MPRVSVELPDHRYDVLIEPGALDRLGAIAADLAPHDRCALIADQRVFDIHGPRALAALRHAGYDPAQALIPSGEPHKTLETVRRLYDVLLDHRLERRSPVIALGGGVCGDTAGFVAATYLRGVPLIQCPTTLLAMVDASVGGKVGVNVPQGKNLIGAFYQPLAVVIDPLVLQTLPPRELRCGLAECVKHAVIRDGDLFAFIRDNLPRIHALDPRVTVELLRRNVAVKAAIVAADEKEAGVRAHLNLGHTFAHTIEATAGYGRYHHGEAVALGLIAAAHLAADLNLCDPALADQLTALLDAIGLPTAADLPDNHTLTAAMALDKKVANNRLRLILPQRLGAVTIRDDIPPQSLAAAWNTIRTPAPTRPV